MSASINTAHKVFVSTDSNAPTPAQPFQVVCIKASGKRVVVGQCPTRQAAESWAALLSQYGRLVGDRAHVEPAELFAADSTP